MGARIRTSLAAAMLVVVAAGPALAASAAEGDIDLGGAALPGGDASTDPGSPTELEAGLWADTLAGGDQPHQFTYTRTMDSSTIHVGVVGAPSDPDGDGLAVEAFEEGGESCASDESTTTYGTPQAILGPGIDVGPTEPDPGNEPCTESRTIRIAVDRGSSTSTTDLPIALKIVEEAPVVGGAADLPTPAPTNPVGAPDGGADRDLAGGTSFDDAPEVQGGTSYTLDLPEGGQRLFKVRLGWGQSLDVRAEIPAQSAKLQEEFITVAVDLSLVDPMRNVFSGEVDDATSSGSYGSERAVISDGVPPLLYLRRFDGAVASLPGDYWVVLNASPNTDGSRQALDVPVSLSVEVRGEQGGAPTYPETLTGPGGSEGPDGYASDTPFLVGDGTFSADPSGNPPPRAGDSGPAADVTVRRIGGAALLVVSLGLCVVGALRLRRRPA